MLVFVENIGQKDDFQQGGVVSDWGWGWGGGPDPKNNNTYLLTVNVYIIFPIKCRSIRFCHKIYLIFPVIGCTPHHGGCHRGVGCPHDAPHHEGHQMPLQCPPSWGCQMQSITVNELQTFLASLCKPSTMVVLKN